MCTDTQTKLQYKVTCAQKTVQYRVFVCRTVGIVQHICNTASYTETTFLIRLSLPPFYINMDAPLEPHLSHNIN